MRDLVSCFSENSINVTHPLSSSLSCSKYSSSNACSSPSLIPSVQTSITSIYRISLSKHLMIKVTWCHKNNPQIHNNGLSISVSSADQNPSTSIKLNTCSRFFRKKKGNKSVDSDLGKIEVFWDLSSAKYDSNLGPEPIQGFYVIVLVDAQLGLLLGDSSQETLRRKGFDFDFDFSTSKYLISRQEHFSGNSFYSTKAKFVETGDSHEIVIRCNGETEGLKQSTHHRSPVTLSVCIDKRTVTKVKRLQWNFRGNQTIFVDGLLVDLMWDVHDWFFANPQGCGRAVFMFRTRNGLVSSRLWLEDKIVKKDDQDKLDFSLLIYACKT